MIASMTGFAAASREFEFGSLSLELRSVNHRYLDIQIRLPDELKSAEAAIREALAARLSRGKIECRVHFSPAAEGALGGQLNSRALEQLMKLDREVRACFQASEPLSVAEVLRWPGVLTVHDTPLEIVRDAALAMLDGALEQFEQSRLREGEKLKTLLIDRVARMEELAADLSPLIPQFTRAYQEKLQARIAEAMLALDDDRLRQEVVLFAARIDVDEELTRLTTHLSEVRRVLQKGGGVGKRLDFLMQELNREANTLGSKSAAAEISRASIELKVLIEQMREQIQNIE